MSTSTSEFLKLNGTDLWKTFRGGLIFLLGYMLVAALDAVTRDLDVIVAGVVSRLPDLPMIDESQLVMGAVVAAVGSLIELGRRLMADYPR